MIYVWTRNNNKSCFEFCGAARRSMFWIAPYFTLSQRHDYPCSSRRKDVLSFSLNHPCCKTCRQISRYGRMSGVSNRATGDHREALISGIIRCREHPSTLVTASRRSELRPFGETFAHPFRIVCRVTKRIFETNSTFISQLGSFLS